MYKNAVELYYSYDLRSASAHAREDIFEKIFYEILIKDELRLSEEIIKISKLKLVQNIPKFEFITRLINATQILSEEKTKFSYDLLIQIKEFFNFCFVQENCPKSMWLWTLNLFRVKHKGIFYLHFIYFYTQKTLRILEKSNIRIIKVFLAIILGMKRE